MTRHGTCNHCGHCCQTFARQAVVRSEMEMDRDPSYYAARGFKPFEIDGEIRFVLFAWLDAPCPQHQDERCAIEANKPATCAAFPRLPVDIVGTPCSYWFEDGETRIGGLGSPHPATEADLYRLESGR